MKRAVVIVAGGSGTRMKSIVPKQFIRLGSKPVIIWTLDAFREFDPLMKIVIVLAEKMMEEWMDLISEYPHYQSARTITGGEERFHSVRNGLALVGNDEVVGIHDAVRPMVTQATLNRCYSMAEKKGNAIPVMVPGDSVRIMNNQNNQAIDRDTVRLVQTPQVFKAPLIKEAYAISYNTSFTDDASVFEAMHGKVHLTEGNRENIKITYPEDLLFAKNILGGEGAREEG
jgi:2-C-methyl-D-erythritol 4-phosphate cytidylyltransferase